MHGTTTQKERGKTPIVYLAFRDPLCQKPRVAPETLRLVELASQWKSLTESSAMVWKWPHHWAEGHSSVKGERVLSFREIYCCFILFCVCACVCACLNHEKGKWHFSRIILYFRRRIQTFYSKYMHTGVHNTHTHTHIRTGNTNGKQACWKITITDDIVLHRRLQSSRFCPLIHCSSSENSKFKDDAFPLSQTKTQTKIVWQHHSR